MTPARHIERLKKQIISETEYYTGTIVLNEGEGEICYQMGLPTNAVWQVEGERAIGIAALEKFSGLSRPLRFKKESRISEEFSLEGITSEQILEYLQKEPEASGAPFLPTGVERRVAPVVEIRRGEASFPLLPLGKPIIASTPPGSALPLDIVIPSLPTSLLILTNEAGLRASAIVQGGKVVDALWTEGDVRLLGRAAAEAVLSNQTGFISGYTLEERLVVAVSALWRMPVVHSEITAGWLDPGNFFQAITEGETDSVVMVRAGDERGVLIVLRGEVIAAYTTNHSAPSRQINSVYELVSGDPTARVTLLAGAVVMEASGRELMPEELFHGKAEEAAFAAPAKDEDQENGFSPRDESEPEGSAPSSFWGTAQDGPTDLEAEAPISPWGEPGEEPTNPVEDWGFTPVDEPTIPSRRSFFEEDESPTDHADETENEGGKFADLIEDDELVEVEESSNSARLQPDWEGDVIPLLISIAARYLPTNSGPVVAILREMDRSAEGVRDTLNEIGHMELHGVTQETMQLMARNMLFQVAEDLTGI